MMLLDVTTLFCVNLFKDQMTELGFIGLWKGHMRHIMGGHGFPVAARAEFCQSEDGSTIRSTPMKRMILAATLMLAVILLSTGVVRAADEREADHDALRKLMKTVTAAMNAQDLKTLEASFTKTFVLTSVDQTVLTNMAGIAAYYDRMFHAADAPLATMKVEPQADVLTQFVGPDAGYCFGPSVDSYMLKNGRVFKFHTRWTAVLAKEDGQWKVAALHSGVNFLDNPALTARSMSFWKKLGIFLHLVTPPYEVAK